MLPALRPRPLPRAPRILDRPETRRLQRLSPRVVLTWETPPDGGASRANSGGRIRTCDLRVMSPTSYQTAPPRNRDEEVTRAANWRSTRLLGQNHPDPLRAFTGQHRQVVRPLLVRLTSRVSPAFRLQLRAPRLPYTFRSLRDVAQPGSALQWGCRGRRFESGRPDRWKVCSLKALELWGSLAFWELQYVAPIRRGVIGGDFLAWGWLEGWVGSGMAHQAWSPGEGDRVGRGGGRVRSPGGEVALGGGLHRWARSALGGRESGSLPDAGSLLVAAISSLGRLLPFHPSWVERPPR